jgi:hypothetical protein
MATLYVEEYTDLAVDGRGVNIPAPGHFNRCQKVTITGASTATTNAVSSKTRYVALATDTACQYELGGTPTADGNSRFLAANSRIFLQVLTGDKVAVISQQ